MHVVYGKQMPTAQWDNLNIEYPVRKHPEIGESSMRISQGCGAAPAPALVRQPRDPVKELQEYTRDYNLTKSLMKSQTCVDFGHKVSETKRFNKHTSCLQNHYIYPPSRRLSERPPLLTAHATTETQSSYREPVVAARLSKDEDQYKELLVQNTEKIYRKELEPIDTTYEGFEKLLDPYLTTTRLHHRPFTADQLKKPSVAQDIITFYTFTNVPWRRTPKPSANEWWLPVKRPKSMCDREEFRQEFRETRTHNKLSWVPGSFRTEVTDNFQLPTSKPDSKLQNYEDYVKIHYLHKLANLPTNEKEEHATIRRMYNTEYSHIGRLKPLSSVINIHSKKV